MDFPSHTITGLKLLGDANITTQNLKRIIESAIALITEKNNFERVGKICPEKREQVEQAYAAFLAFIVHAAQINISEDSARECLVDICGLSEDRCQLILDALATHQQEVAKKLSNIETLPPKIIDVNWKLDFVIKSNSKNHVGEAIYLLVLTTEQEGVIKHVRFTCDQFQLQELSIRLREIVHQVEVFAAS